MSKMAAFRAGTYRDRDGYTGPQTRVPISAFLEDNGFVPSRPSRAPQRGATAGPSQGPSTPMSLGSAPVADMDGLGNPFAGANGLPSSDPRGRAPVGLTPLNRRGSAPARHLRITKNQGPPSPFLNGTKASSTPGPFANMSSEPMLASIEGEGPTVDTNETLGRIQIEMGHLRTICQNVIASNSNIRELDLRNVQAEMGMEKNHVRDLDVRVSQLEGVMHALQNTELGNIVERVNELEAIVEDLKGKVGSGCDAEVAKMREVMGALKRGLDKVGGFI